MQKLKLPFTEDDYNEARSYFERVERYSGFCAEMALCHAYDKKWEHGYDEADIELYNAPIQVKSRLVNGTRKVFYSTHQARGYNKVRGFIFGEVFYDLDEQSGYFEIYPYVFATEYVLGKSEDLKRGGNNYGPHIHEDHLDSCSSEFKHEIKEEHLIGLQRA
tara:strand:- start:375 stop:860 length:486 start_codon:yes stop_codon:yes gene_type:complete